MFKRGQAVMFCAIVIVFLFLLSCLPSFDAQNLILNDPRVKIFLQENPNSDITIVHLSAEESVIELPKFSEVCGKTLTAGKEMYKAELVDSVKGLKIIAYLDADTKFIECVRRFGAEGKPAENAPEEPTAQPITTQPTAQSTLPTATPPTTSSPVCSNGIKEGAEECDDGNTNDNDACSATCVKKCYDSDGGKDSKRKGTVKVMAYSSTTATEYPDVCMDEAQVIEYSCGTNVVTPDKETIYCNYKCQEGACVERPAATTPPTATSPTTSSPVCGNGIKEGAEECDDGNQVEGDGCGSSCTSVCTETDNRNEPAVRGTTKGIDIYNRYQEKTDLCVNSTRIKEYYCAVGSTSRFLEAEQTCTWGCADGACRTEPAAELPEEPSCTDSDGGNDLYKKGTTKDKYSTQTDSCDATYPNSVWEYYCGTDNLIRIDKKSCAYGCVDGICLPEPTVASVCGNGIKESGEQCDDGNTRSSDGCSSTCQWDRRLVY